MMASVTRPCLSVADLRHLNHHGNSIKFLSRHLIPRWRFTLSARTRVEEKGGGFCTELLTTNKYASSPDYMNVGLYRSFNGDIAP